MKILVINGPNLNKLGSRDNSHYGKLTLNDIEAMLQKEFPKEYFEFFQSNLEGEIIDKIHNAEKYFDALLINPGGYAHTSVATKDALNICNIIKIEVHLSNLASREEYRRTTLTASECNGYISGFKEFSYAAAVYLAKKIFMNY